MKGKRLLAFILAFVLAFPAAWGNSALALDAQAEEVQELRIENLRNEQEEITWVFSDETYTVSLNTEGMENITQVRWGITLYQDGEAVGIHDLDVPQDEIYFIDPENYTITLYGEGLALVTEYMRDGNQWFDLGVCVDYGEGEYYEKWAGVFYAAPEYQITYLANQGDDEMLPNEDKYIPNSLEVFVWDKEHPYEVFAECQITDMEMLGQYTWDENGEEVLAEREFFWLDGNAEVGWNLHSDDHGFALLRAHYMDVDGNEAIYDFRVYSIGEIYYLEFQFDKDTNNILTNSETTINTRLIRNYQDDEGENHYGEEIEDYFLRIHSGYEQDLVLAEVSEDGKQIQMKTAEEEAHVGFWVEVCRMDGEEEVSLRETNFDIWSLNEFCNIEPTFLGNPGIGETLDLSSLAVYRYNEEYPDGEEVPLDNVRLFVTNYEGNVWEPTEDLSENPLPNFVRTGFEGGHIRIAAEERSGEEWGEIAQRYFWFDGLDYSVRFEDMQNGDHGWVYVDDEVTFHLNTENLADTENCEVTFDLGLHQEETEEFIPFEMQEGLFETLTEDGNVTGIKIKGSDIKKIEDSLREGGWFWVRVTVTLNGQEVHSEWRGVELRETELEYNHRDWGFGMLPHWDHGIDKNFGYYLRDEENPEGYEGEIQYTDISMEILDGEEDALEIHEWEDGNGWNLHANDYGHAVVTLTYPNVLNPEESMEHSFDVWIGQDVWELQLKPSTGTTDICPGGAMNLIADISHHCYNEEEGHFEGDTENVTYEWNYTGGVNQELLDFEADGNVLHITAREDAEYNRNTCIYVRAYQTDEDGNIMKNEDGSDMEVCYNDIWLNIRDGFFTIYPLEIEETLEVDETVKITPELRFVSETEDREHTENVVFNWQWNPEAVEITDNEGNALAPTEEYERSPYGTGTYTLKKLSTDGSELWLRAFIEEDGEYHEVFCRNLYVEHVDYNVDFTDMQNGDHGWVYVNDEVTFHINTDNLQDKENYELNFEIGVDQDEQFIPFEDQTGLFEVVTENENIVGIKVKGSEIKTIEDQLRDGGWFCIRVTVTVGGKEVFSAMRGVELREIELDYHYNEWGLSMLPAWDHGIDKNFGYYLRDAQNPDGYDGEIQYTDIQVEIVEGEEDALVVDEWEDGNGWNLHANSYGHAVVTLTHEDVSNPGETLQHSFDVWIGQDVWNIEFRTSTGTTDICPGGELDLIASVEHHCYNEEDGHFEGATDPLYYDWGYTDGSNEGIFDYEAEGNVVHISAREDAEYNERAGLYLRIYPLDEEGNIITDEEGNNIEFCYADTWFDIREAYFSIQPLELEEPFELGETVEITPTLHFVNEFENSEHMDGIVFEWEWNPENIEIKDSEGNVLTPNENRRSDFGTGTYTLRKLVSWDTNLHLRAYVEEDGEYREMAHREYGIRGIDYNSWFEKDRGEEWTTYLFEGDEAYQVILNTDNLRDENGNLKENISIEWIVCVVDEEENIIETAENGKEYTLSEDGTSIFLNGGLLKENEFGIKGRASRIFVNVESNGINVQGHPYCLSFWVQEEYVELENDYDSDTLLAEIGGWYHGPEGIGGYVRNMMYPDGAELMFEVRNIETHVTDDADGEVFDIVHNEDGSWRIAPLRCGQAEITYTLYHETLGEVVVTREKGVGDEIYRVEVFTDTHTLGMLPNSELNLITEVIQFKSYEDGSWTETYISEDRYEVSYDYNRELIGIDENGKVTSYGEFGETGVHIEAKVQMLGGQDYYTNTNTEIRVTDYDMKSYGEDCTVNVDDTIYVSDLGIQMIETTLENPEGIAYEPEDIEIADMNWLQLSEDGESFTIIKEELGDEFPVARRLYYKAVYEGMEYYDWLTITINKEEPPLKDEWRYDGIGWWYSYAQGGYPSNCWKQIDGQWYWFNASGYRTTGWLYSAGKWYYMNDKGIMTTGWLLNGGSWYYMNSSGAMVTGWIQIGGIWYYMNSSGAMVTGWIQIGGTWYYMNSSGAMVTGWIQSGGSWYYMNSSGAMVTGWLKQGNTWYYLKSGGAMATGRIVIDGKMNVFSSSGAWLGYV